jgi:hypothetical protein
MEKAKEDPSSGPPPPEPLGSCSCRPDPFAGLPPEVRPKAEVMKSDLRQVTCPACGLEYWTNRATDICLDCDRTGAKKGP